MSGRETQPSPPPRPAGVDLLYRLVATPSVSGDEDAAAALVTAELAALGFAPQRSGNNVWAVWGEGRPRLLLNSHLDTVPPCAGWTSDPYTPVWDGERLAGLGANDAKGCVAAILLAARALRDAGWAPPRGSVVFGLTAGEEIGRDGIETVLDRFGPLDAAVNGEPNGLHACTAQRGMLVLRCVAEGSSGHVAHAGLEGSPLDNAIHRAARDISRLAALRFPCHPLLGEPRAQVTTIEGGLTLNQIPDRCQFHVDLRTTPDLDHTETTAAIAAALESRVEVRSDRYLPKETPADAAIVRAALAAIALSRGGDRDAVAPVGSRTASDWAFLGDVPTVKVGPGDTHRSHRPDEFLTLDELRAGARVYAETTRRYFDAVEATR